LSSWPCWEAAADRDAVAERVGAAVAVGVGVQKEAQAVVEQSQSTGQPPTPQWAMHAPEAGVSSRAAAAPPAASAARLRPGGDSGPPPAHTYGDSGALGATTPQPEAPPVPAVATPAQTAAQPGHGVGVALSDAEEVRTALIDAERLRVTVAAREADTLADTAAVFVRLPVTLGVRL
jgi:hypothetical protein